MSIWDEDLFVVDELLMIVSDVRVRGVRVNDRMLFSGVLEACALTLKQYIWYECSMVQGTENHPQIVNAPRGSWIDYIISYPESPVQRAKTTCIVN
jgi:hypothetical protein